MTKKPSTTTSRKLLSLEDLSVMIEEKISKKEKNSYTYELAKGGAEKTTRKVGEEAVEVVIAAFMNEQKNNEKTRSDLIGEVSDLFFHSLVLLASQGIEYSDILAELHRRNVKIKEFRSKTSKEQIVTKIPKEISNK